MSEEQIETAESIGPKIMRYIKVAVVVIVASVGIYYFIAGMGITCINVWDNTALPFRLPTMLIAAFLIGFVPLYIWHELSEWRWESRIRELEDELTGRGQEAGQPEI